MAGNALTSYPARGYVLLTGVAFGWGVNWPFMKIIVSEVSVWEFRALTGIAAGLLLLGLAVAAGGSSGEAWKRRARSGPGSAWRRCSTSRAGSSSSASAYR